MVEVCFAEENLQVGVQFLLEEDLSSMETQQHASLLGEYQVLCAESALIALDDRVLLHQPPTQFVRQFVLSFDRLELALHQLVELGR